MGKAKKIIEILDVTLRDGEQTQGVSFSRSEKLNIAKILLNEVGIDRIEVASARVSQGEKESVTSIIQWAKLRGFLSKVEVLGFVDHTKSVDWIVSTGAKVMNLLTKGSEKHLKFQLRKDIKTHISEIKETIDYAKEKGLTVNIYLEDWSNGYRDSKDYVMEITRALCGMSVNRIMLPDTLGILTPHTTYTYVKDMVNSFPDMGFDFHAHNDYGLATANSLYAIEAGVGAIHVTVNCLGERTGNASLGEIAANIHDNTECETHVVEKKIVSASKLVETFSGKRVAANTPIVGQDVFTQTSGIHADGDKKANLYANPLLPERFGRKRTYALGKLSGKASLDQNLTELGIELTEENKKKVLREIIQLGDKKKSITIEDLPFIIADVLEIGEGNLVQITDCIITSGKGILPTASFVLQYGEQKIKESASGNGGYDAFMNALKKACSRIKLSMPELIDYEVRIPPGGKTSALVETLIIWSAKDKIFKTIGVDSDQIIAAIKASERMLNIIARANQD